MKTNDDLADSLLRTSRTSDEVVDAFRAVDRANFVPQEFIDEAYEDYPLPIGDDQTISQPSTVAFMLTLLDVQQGMRVLDVGCGSGYTTALLAYLVGDKGEVIGVERMPSLVGFAQENLSSYAHPHVRIEQATASLGWPRESPYDRILVSAEADTIPQALLEQLSSSGVMVLPVAGSVYRVEKDSKGEVSEQRYPGFMFVPLIE